MERKKFVQLVTAGSSAALSGIIPGIPLFISRSTDISEIRKNNSSVAADVVIAGGGLGGCAAAMAALRNNLKVILTEETDWLGGQLSQQGVPPDEHQWIETHGGTRLYREFRNKIREYYFRNYPLTETARANKNLNPGDGSVSRLCHEPRVAVAVLNELLAPYISSGQLVLLTNYKASSADSDRNKVRSLTVTNLLTGDKLNLDAGWFIDATELGDLLPLTGTEFVTGTESKKDTGELHAPEKGDPENNQSFTVCFAMDYIEGEDHTIEKPLEYDFWKNHIPPLTPPWSGKLLELRYSTPSTLVPKELGFHPLGADTSPLLNLWNYRRIISKNNFIPGTYRSDISVVNWPQNDYMLGNIISGNQEDFNKHFSRAKQLSLSLLYWLQTEAPGPDKGYGWKGLRLRKDIMGTNDGLAKYPYIRESRRIKPLFRILEEHVGKENRSIVTGEKENIKSARFYDSVGTGYYHIDLHPSCGGNNYIDFPSLPFQIPLGALIPQRVENLIPANKNIGTTHITNGCYRLHPVEWNIGESAGALIAFSSDRKVTPATIRENRKLLEEFQMMIRSQGIETEWPE
ncbi:MAG: FAD-dependent oxidoreductase [Bacteroidetes bacterium]|nr:FAD-dependent oxidoreductase [Bacteroidota bacterium]